ncbi:hypothetical protein N7450_009670 [Penicillium hetheringtonii]|uniref:Uncharacterized protein n=1 Tax=Penicillium hetheringtonii TaxID=911720 RepID=A0AAD6DC96_9EURO|nr:hypothetical protein N7450_009670 [Penicillium hetheringtonii]
MSLKQALKKVPAGVPLPWKFHHEIWEKPWESQSGDFPPHETELEHGQRQRQIKSERWFRHHRGMSGYLMQEEIGRWQWRYTMYRTVFNWNQTFTGRMWWMQFEKISLSLLRFSYKKIETITRIHTGFYAMDIAVLNSKTKLVSTELLLNKFASNSKILLRMNSLLLVLDFRWCLLIDSKALQSFICYPQPVKASDLSELDAFERNGAWVTVVDPEYKPGSYTKGKPRFYQGYMRCHLNRLLSLAWAGSMKHMSKMIRRDADGIPWYEENI